MADEGRWVTVHGRRVFIGDGEDLETAMKKSGKFDNKQTKTTPKTGSKAHYDKIKEWEHKLEHAETTKDIDRLQDDINDYTRDVLNKDKTLDDRDRNHLESRMRDTYKATREKLAKIEGADGLDEGNSNASKGKVEKGKGATKELYVKTKKGRVADEDIKRQEEESGRPEYGTTGKQKTKGTNVTTQKFNDAMSYSKSSERRKALSDIMYNAKKGDTLKLPNGTVLTKTENAPGAIWKSSSGTKQYGDDWVKQLSNEWKNTKTATIKSPGKQVQKKAWKDMSHQERVAEMQKDGERYAKDPTIADKEKWSDDYKSEVIDYARPIMAQKRQSAVFKNDPAKKVANSKKKVAEEKKEEWHSETPAERKEYLRRKEAVLKLHVNNDVLGQLATHNYNDEGLDWAVERGYITKHQADIVKGKKRKK